MEKWRKIESVKEMEKDRISGEICIRLYDADGRCGGLKISALDSGVSGPGSSPGPEHYVVFLGKTFYSHSTSLHGYWRI